jgi:hypothetical protein
VLQRLETASRSDTFLLPLSRRLALGARPGREVDALMRSTHLRGAMRETDRTWRVRSAVR